MKELLVMLIAVSVILFVLAMAEIYPLSGKAALISALPFAAAAAAAVLSIIDGRRSLRKAKQLRNELTGKLDAAVAEKETAKKECRDNLYQFQSKVSHSLRIPISVIQGYVSLLKEGLVEDEAVFNEYLSRIYERTEYINDLFGQILLEARSEGNISSIPLEPVDICRLVERIAEDTRAAALQLNITISVVLSEESMLINGDVNLLTKIFYNILGNSLKYMKREGMINITVSREGDEILVIFKDGGMGLSEEETEHIFELNYQGSNKTTGDGFGLYYVKNGVVAHGGRVFAKSSIGNGMSIYMSFPALAEVNQPES